MRKCVTVFLAVFAVTFAMACSESPNGAALTAPTALTGTAALTAPTASGASGLAMSAAGNGGGFDEFGYNNTAGIFNGTGASWALSKGLPADYLGIYAPDKLVMKWNAEWDRGNAEGWAVPPYAAWEDNEWNGKAKGGSGEIWHYKIVWDAGCTANGVPSVPGLGVYCVWGQFEVLMDQGHDPNVGPGHLWLAKAKPNGLGN
jgi:hypothetical protein